MNIELEKVQNLIDRLSQVWETLKRYPELENIQKEIESIAFELSNN